ncbi:hypothetical protein WR25_02273 isoform I [Diploscapter pachys]|uniref:Cullin-1 n=1 Tax=Diploscapter pachys TaxID=2018661 RepID=A0A2A2JGV3_9BILA|nr:hypothetical protein WR25_02273 isoform A [Diploscapter pachys]PAV60858.1 hypothetical protein WR25_02273 isoform E [Diploscapter pachys]PAV60860.1 hypothetical protein WR25_02273 isoform G [Diploscapter pachys]PAV60862.1 hypothetical protein WR25_02273 isoform I [Diploscapter pachys]
MAAMNGLHRTSAAAGVLTASRNLDDVWLKLSEGLNTVYNGQLADMNKERYMSLYTEVYNYCACVNTSADQHHEHRSMQSHGADLVGMEMYRKLENYIRNHVVAKKEAMGSFRGEELLIRYHEEWVNFRFSSQVMNGIFQYLNRHWIKRELDEGNNEIYVTFTLALMVWRQSLFMQLKDYVTDALLDLIQRERDGIKISTTIIKGVIESYVDLGIDEYEPSAQNTAITGNANSRDKLRVYKEHFEDRFIKKTEEYYSAEASNFLQNGSVVEYMKKVEKRLDEEQNRCGNYINEATQIPLAKALEKVLIQSRLELFQNEFGGLLEQHKDEDLARMYKLCERVDRGLDELRIALERHIAKEGHAEIDKVTEQAFNDPKLYVSTILYVHQRYSKLVGEAFVNEPGFLQSLDKAATNFINKNSVTLKAEKHAASKSSELLARHCDGLLRKSAKLPEEEELEKMLDDVMIVFKYIEDKDVFSKHYTKMFSKRLIYDQSASEDAEVSLINKLKQNCGFEYTSKLTKMITDMQLSKDLCGKFRSHCSDTGKDLGVDLNILVLTSGTWPTMPPLQVQLPEKLNGCLEEFKAFYNQKHNGRKLNWILSQSRGEVAANCFKPKKYLFTLTTAQIALVDQFNRSEEFEFSALLSSLGMDKATLSQVVNSLVKGLLLKHSTEAENGEYANDTTISLNKAYTNKKVKVDLSKMAMRVDVSKEADSVQKNVDEDRKAVINACIVRVLKMRRRIVHNDLIAEVHI